MHTYRYISGRGYIVRNAEGQIVAQWLTRRQLISFLSFVEQGCVAAPMLGA